MKWNFLAPNGADLYIDLGTANTLVVSREGGIVANEPSVVCYMDHGPRRAVIAVGNEAKVKMGRTPGVMTASFPLREGVIADLDITEAMLKYFISKVGPSKIFRPRLVMSLPYGVSDIEKSAVRQAGQAAGAREVILIEEPIAAAIGSGLPVAQPTGNLVIDIGGGTTEVAVISLCGIVHCESVRVGGHAFDQAIVHYIRRQYNLIVGEPSAERVKIQIGSAMPEGYNATAEIRGVDATNGLPREVTITASEVYYAIEDLLEIIFDAGRRTLESTPPDLVSSILENGAIAAGGGSLLNGLDRRLSEELRIPVKIAEEPLLAIARGGEKTLHNPQLLSRITLD